MPTPDWNERYEHGETPWDIGQADPHLVEFVYSRRVEPCRVLEIGSGTGTDALWLAERGFDVLGVELSPRAVERAEAKAAKAPGSCRFAVTDFLETDLPEAAFDFIYDRGCFHAFDDPQTRARFANRVATRLAPDGQWLSLLGSTEGPHREHGPPRRSARDIVQAIEPVLELAELRAVEFIADLPSPACAWFCLARRRRVEAQPSTGSGR